ncbi:hypothetical protein [Halomonas saccharevitans]|uniref:Uncharacterized protein n=1 Tax=Halomonas saccharevitans TaxID=416872 RepID=A0A1I6YWW3_9GAMM|nr:hypothetical protein [Halomonas saccharevitans]SFT54844.1 hypothetical protein SAMN04487956_107102 [Halomonas saccharevitans]
MKVSINKLSVDMEVKQRGVEFRVYDNQDSFRGDMYVVNTGLIWCKGRTKKENGIKVTWEEFIELMEE